MRTNQIEIYQSPNGETQVDVTFKDGEIPRESNMQKMHIANFDKPVSLYDLEVVIPVGYRIKSLQGLQFRRWATQRLKDYLVQGFALDRAA